MKEYKFEVIITYFADHDEPTEESLELGALYYGDKHQDFGMFVVPGSIVKVDE